MLSKVLNNQQIVNISIQNPIFVEKAYHRIKDLIVKTPIMTSDDINQEFGHEFFFKIESLQHSKAFKIRGILNHLLELKERVNMPQKVVAYSTGNHGIGLSVVANWFKIHARIYLPKNTSVYKQDIIKYNHAELIVTETRQEAEDRTKDDALNNGFYYLHPSDSDTTIAGVGTMCYEALTQLNFTPDAIFASCGGGGLLSGTYLAKELLSAKSLIFGSEPKLANDAFVSRQHGTIFRFKDSSSTIADGLRALSLSQRTFEYIKKLDGMYTVQEDDIKFWTKRLISEFKMPLEPSSAINMPAALQWLASNQHISKQKILILISGGNV